MKVHQAGASPGRSGHRLAIEAGRTVLEARIALAELFNAPSPLDIIFTKNATEALNISTLGLLRAGDHVITSSMEHNSLMRPLRFLESRGVEVTVARCSPEGELDPEDIRPLIKNNTRAIYLTHASNVSGAIMPVERAGAIAREHGILFCVDAAQTAGAIPIERTDEYRFAFTVTRFILNRPYIPQGTPCGDQSSHGWHR